VALRILPKEVGFFDQFEKHADRIVEGARLFEALLGDLENSGPKAKRIKEIEHEADVITHDTVEMLHKTFITPFDRNDMYRLIGRMDDILDAIESSAERISLYDITEPKADAQSLAKVLYQATEQVRVAVKCLRQLKKESPKILEACVECNRLENEGDAILRQGLARLFREEEDPLVVIKWKEIFETMEYAADRCEDAANVIEGLVLEPA
jgi:predicted phosphate transport protein (TIGR00153 family)